MIKRFKKWPLLIMMIFISCKSSKDLPGNVLPVNEMKEVIWDMIQADEYTSFRAVKDSSIVIRQESLKLYGKVLALHKITAADFEKSYQFYKLHPAEEKMLLDSLQSYANKMREHNYQKISLELPPPIAADSALKN